MARYTQDIVLNKPNDFVAFMMNDFLQKSSFTMNTWKGSPAYRRGDGFFEGFRYLTWNYSNGVLHLEAWFKGLFGGEQALSGFWGWAAKASYRKDIEQLIVLLQQTLPEPSPTGSVGADGNTPAVAIPVQTMDNSRNATLALVFGILSPCICLLVPILGNFGILAALYGLVAACLSIMFYRSSKNSSKSGQAQAGRICAIIGLCIVGIVYAMYILRIFILFNR